MSVFANRGTRSFLHATVKAALLCSVAASSALIAGPAQAQQAAAAGGLEEVVVTARKVQENLMQVPLSIVAVTASSLESADIKDARELAPYTPGLFISYAITNFASQRNLFFRGDPLDQGLTFIDGAPYGGGDANPDLNTLERVEVLVGPQSAYFGRSTYTGAINFVTKDPADTFKGRISAEYSSFNSNNESMTLEGPIVKDKLGIRVTASHYLNGGEWTNAVDTNDKLGSVQRDDVSAVIVLKPSDKLKVKTFLEYGLDNFGPTPIVALSGWGSNPSAPNVPAYQSRQLFCNQGGSFGSWWCGALPSAKALPGMGTPGTAPIISSDDAITPTITNALIHNAYNIAPPIFDPSWLTHTGSKSLSLSWHTQINYATEEGWNFASNTAIHKFKEEAISSPDERSAMGVPNPYAVSAVGVGGFGPTHAVLPSGSATPSVPVANYPGLPYLGFVLLSGTVIYDASQELRLTSPQDKKLRGTLGVSYFEKVSPGNFVLGLEPLAAGVGTNSIARSSVSTPAVFGGLYYDVTPQVTLTAEARQQWDRIGSTTKFIGGVAGGGAQPELESVFKSFSPRVDIDYKFMPDQMLYALWSVGYSPGGFNASIVGQTAAISAQLAALGSQLTFAQEKLVNWEGGLKSTWWDGRIRTTIDGYYDKWENGQVTNSLSVIGSGGNSQMVSVTQNVGLTKLYGIEFTGAAALTKQLTITANYNYVKSDIKSYFYFPTGGRITSACAVNNGGTCTIGKSFPLNPIGSTFAISPTYTDHLAGDWEWYGRLDWKHRGRYYIDFVNLAWIKATDTVDLHAGLKDQNKTIDVFVTNLTNQQNFSSGEVGTDATSYNPANVNEARLFLPPKRTFGVRATYNF